MMRKAGIRTLQKKQLTGQSTSNKKKKDFWILHRIMILGSFLDVQVGVVNEHTRKFRTA